MTDAWTKTLPLATSGWNGYSLRQFHPIVAGAAQVRAWFHAPPSGVMVLAHAALGKQASGRVTQATPVECRFNGAAGLIMAAGEPDRACDWIDLATVEGEALVSILDHALTASSMASNSTDGNGLCHQWAAGGAQSYNQANPGGTWNCNPATWSHAINRIEVREAPEPPPPGEDDPPQPTARMKRPPLHSMAETYDADDLVRGSDGIEYYALQQTQGVNPVTEGFPRQHWAFRAYHIGNGYYMTGLAKTGPGGIAARQEALAWYGSQELNLGQSTRPDIPVAVWHNFRTWQRSDDYRFNEPCPNLTDKPHPGLSFAPIGAGALYAPDLDTVISPELKVQTGASLNAGGKITAPHSVAGLFTPQAWNWVFRLGALSNQKLELGVESANGQNKLCFKREDAGSQGTWKCVTVVNGTVTEHNTGLSTGTERIWFQIARNLDLASGVNQQVRFSIGTVSGENPPGQNVLKERHAVAASALFDPNTLLTPYLSFQNTAAANRDLYFWRAWFDLL